MYMCEHTWRSHRSTQLSFFWFEAGYLTTAWSSPVHVGWMAREHQGADCLSILGHRMETVFHHAQLFMWDIGIKLRSSCFCSKCFTDQVISLGLRQLLTFAMETLFGRLIFSTIHDPHLLRCFWGLRSGFGSLRL